MHNNQKYYEFQTDLAVKQRLADNRLANVIPWDTELEDLNLPAQELDAIFLMLVLHDFYWMSDSPKQVIESLYDSLKPGGVLGIVDHSAKIGSGIRDAQHLQGLHRIDESYVISMLEQVGFILISETDVLRNSLDKREYAFFDDSIKGQATDRFVLKFSKPAAKD